MTIATDRICKQSKFTRLQQAKLFFYSFSQTDLKMETGFLFCYGIYEQFYRLRVEIEIGK